MQHRWGVWMAIVIAVGLSACTTGHTVRTIGKGNYGIEGTFGGPLLTNLGPAIPAPNLFIGGRYGLQDTLDISVAYNLTAPVSPGLPLDLITGIHWVPVQPGVGTQSDSPERGWSLATHYSFHWMSDFDTGFIVIPAIELAGGWRHKWFNPFIGLSTAFNFYRPFEQDPVAMVSPFVGTDLIFTKRFSMSLRVTFFDVAYNLYGSQVEWVYLAKDAGDQQYQVPLGISLGFAWDFEKKENRQ